MNFEGTYELIKEPYCKICAHPEVSTEECTEDHPTDGFDRAYTMGIYYPLHSGKSNLITKHILKLKRDPDYASPLGIAMAITIMKIYPILLESDIMVPVPSTVEELKTKRFNHSSELSKVLTAQLKIPTIDVMQKTEKKSLQGLKLLERREAVKGLYLIPEYAKEQIKGKKVLLVDDVMTTCSTSSECARQLKLAGAKSVNVIVAGR